MTSHDVVGYVRHVLHQKRVGHAGTLDPGASGVLPVAVGPSARLIEYLEATGKTYRAEVRFGFATDSGDDTGEIIAKQQDFVLPSRESIEAALQQFKGRIKQVPPAHSAIKIEGRRACDLVREGMEVEMPEREVEIYRLELLAVHADSIILDVDCSKGTYIRSLCADIGKALGIPAAMSFLVRRRVGAFVLAEAVSLEELAEQGAAALLPPDLCLGQLPRYELRKGRRRAFCNGLSSTERCYPGESGELRVYAEGEFLGIGYYDAGTQSVTARKVIVQN